MVHEVYTIWGVGGGGLLLVHCSMWPTGELFPGKC